MLLAILCIDQKVKRVRDSDVAQMTLMSGWSRPSRVNDSSTDFDSCTVSQIIRGLSNRPCLIREGLGRHSLDRGTSQFPWISGRGARRPTSIGAARGKIGRSLAFQCQKTIDGRRCRIPKSPHREAGASSGAVLYIGPVQDVPCDADKRSWRVRS
jgi:hypothetical protein